MRQVNHTPSGPRDAQELLHRHSPNRPVEDLTWLVANPSRPLNQELTGATIRDTNDETDHAAESTPAQIDEIATGRPPPSLA